MFVIRTYPYQNSTVLRIYSEKDSIDKEPGYQRKGDLWSLKSRQLLIDSILNDYDIPKLYFHVLSSEFKSKNSSLHNKNNKFSYAIIDGRQRLEAIWGFIDGEFPLAEDFVYYKDESITARNLTYFELAQKYPKLKIIFDSFVLPIICVETDEIDVIEDMFLRLNETVSLVSAETRNAIGGSMAKAVRDVSKHAFFEQKMRVTNKRYQHREIAARLLFIEYTLGKNNKITDTKKSNLDNFVYEFKDFGKEASTLQNSVEKILDFMSTVFKPKDELLRAQSIVPIYYLVFKYLLKTGAENKLKREHFLKFRDEVDFYKNSDPSQKKSEEHDFLLFNRLSIQGTNDASSIKKRYEILKNYILREDN